MRFLPGFTEFKRSAKRHNVIAVSMDLAADLETPVSVFLKLASNKKHAFLLESVELGEKLGRFSLIGMEPEVTFEYVNQQCVVSKKGAGKSRLSGNLLEVTQRVMKDYRFASNPKLPSLVGGFVGYIGYELVQQFEDIQLKIKKGLPIPDSVLFFPTNLIVFDHIKHELKLIHLSVVHGSVKSAYQKAEQKLRLMAQQLKKAAPKQLEPTHEAQSSVQLRSNVSQTRFESMVRKAKEHIRAGDCIQIVLSQRFALGRISDDFKLYRILRSLNPSPYMFYFRNRDLSLIGSSPEMLTRKTGQKAEIRPIAGTRPRGDSEEKDMAYEAALKASPKEMAEHLMLVDLGRNDLGRVSNSKSVRVNDFARVERYSHVMHLVSDVQATLKKGKTAFDLLKASFPAGTVTGAPKIRAMQIIDDLEPEKRGPYAGSLGYFSLKGNMDMCITIRTIVIHRKQAYVQAGAGIVMDSIPHKEYQETINKAKALFQAVEKARRS
jgi:anthranilate synthase component I